MKFIISSGMLLKQLQTLAGVIGSNNATLILDNFLFELKGGLLTITASDLETTMRAVLEVEGEDDGMVAIPAKMLVDTLKSLPEMPVHFSFDSETMQMEVGSEYGKYSISCLDGEEFPALPELENPATVTIPAGSLQKAIQKTLFAAANDEMRPVVSGVFMQISEDMITFVATDAHKLVRYRLIGFENQETGSFVMPKKPLTILKSILGQAVSMVDVHYNKTNIRFEFDEVTVVTRLVEGKYPNYEAVIPQNNPFNLVINRAAFLSSVRRVSIFSSKSSSQIRLKISGSEIHISAEDLDYANRANERLQCSFEGEDLLIGFSSKFLIEVLSNMESDEIRIELSAPNRAGLVFPMDGIDTNEDLVMLVMPVMVASAD